MAKFTNAKIQCKQLLDHLREHRSITTREARQKYDMMSPPARIYDLRAKGHEIYRELITVDGHPKVAKYTLIKEAFDDELK